MCMWIWICCCHLRGVVDYVEDNKDNGSDPMKRRMWGMCMWWWWCVWIIWAKLRWKKSLFRDGTTIVQYCTVVDDAITGHQRLHHYCITTVQQWHRKRLYKILLGLIIWIRILSHAYWCAHVSDVQAKKFGPNRPAKVEAKLVCDLGEAILIAFHWHRTWCTCEEFR